MRPCRGGCNPITPVARAGRRRGCSNILKCRVAVLGVAGVQPGRSFSDRRHTTGRDWKAIDQAA
eukprot:11187419-Lingulodinium_polyedra.AAC.1